VILSFLHFVLNQKGFYIIFFCFITRRIAILKFPASFMQKLQWFFQYYKFAPVSIGYVHFMD